MLLIQKSLNDILTGDGSLIRARALAGLVHIQSTPVVYKNAALMK